MYNYKMDKGGYELEKYTIRDKGKFLFALIFLSSIAGLTMTGIWVFSYGETTEDIRNKEKTDKSNQYLLIAGSVLTVVAALVFIVTIIKLHEEKEV